jgi:hypothetical protein
MRIEDSNFECGIVYKRILINAKLQIGEINKTELTGRNPLRR